MSDPSAASESETSRRRLLLVGWDSADWKIIHPMIDRGELPALASILEGGVSGNLATLEPQLSPMLWTSIATGKMAYHHGVAGFTEVDGASGEVVPVSAATRRCKAIWEILGERGLRSHVVGWFATQGERDLEGCMVSNLYPHLDRGEGGKPPEARNPPPPGTYWPPDLGRALDELRVSAEEIDPDGVLRQFVPEAAEVDQKVDQRLALLAERLAEAFSIQAAATWLMEDQPDWDFMAVYFRAIDEISHIFMPYHPPRMEEVPERDFRIYQHVVAMTYRLHDMMLQRLMDLAGPDCAVVVVSDHGFHSDHLRPRFTPNVPAGITVWHRRLGMLAARGDGFRKDCLVHGATLLDLTPTFLHWFGLPVGKDMEGRVLMDALEGRGEVEFLATWEAEGQERPRPAMGADQNRELLDQFVKLGYIEKLSDDPTEAAWGTARENSWNLARANLYGGRFEQALPLLEKCVFEFPERSDHAQLLARCQMALGLLDEAEATAELAMATAGNRGGARLILAYLALERGRNRQAMEILDQCQEEDAGSPMLWHYLSLAYVGMRKWADAATVAEKMLEVDPSDARAHLILARCWLHQGKEEAAAEAALKALSVDFSNARGHFLLGCALYQSGEAGSASIALERAVRLGVPELRARTYRLLAMIARNEGDVEKAQRCHLLSREVRKHDNSGELRRLREGIVMRAAAREDERMRLRERTGPVVPARLSPPMELWLVSGMPRSGTSLMMQIMEAAGVVPMTDGERRADEDNPEGYYEWEAVKTLPKNPAVIEEAVGKVTKVISALLPHLPPQHRYKIVFMTRPAAQIAKSQGAMLDRRGERPSEAGSMEANLEDHAARILGRLKQIPNVDLLEVPYPELVASPGEWLEKLDTFLPGHRFNAPELLAVVRPELHRNR